MNRDSSLIVVQRTQPKRGRLNRGGTSAPLADVLGLLEVQIVLRFRIWHKITAGPHKALA